MNSYSQRTFGKRLLPALVLSGAAIVSGTAHAQFSVGFRGGLSASDLSEDSGNIYADGYESVTSDEFAFVLEYRVSDQLSVVSEIGLTERGGERKGMQPIPARALAGLGAANPGAAQGFSQLPENTVLHASFDNESTPEYIEIPVLLKYRWGGLFRPYVNGGVYLGWLTDATQKTSGNSAVFIEQDGTYVPLDQTEYPFNSSTDISKDLESFNAGLQIGAGAEYALAEHHGLLLDLRASRGLIAIQKDASQGETSVGGAVLSLEYLYRF